MSGRSRECIEQLAAFERALPLLQSAFRHLETKLPRPVPTQVYGRMYPRYTEKSAQQAALQKMARYVSGLKAITILLGHRMLQEDGVMKRTLDELGDDIVFLALGPESDDDKALHKRFLDSFYQEEFGEGIEPIDSTKWRDQIRRGKIRSYIERRMGSSVAQGKQASSVIYQSYSGYVHSASPHLMEMCSFHDFKFRVLGIDDLDLFESHVRDAANYFFRGFLCMAALASILGDPLLHEEMKAQADALLAAWP